MIDWLAAVLTATNVWLLGDQNRWGFAFGILGNLLWMYFAAITAQIPLFGLNVIFLGLNVRGFWKWSRDQTNNPDEPSD